MIEHDTLEPPRTRATSGRILLVIQNDRNRSLLRELLAPAYDVAVAAGRDDLDGPFDLCLLDDRSFSQLRDLLAARKEADRPLFLPYLLVTSNESTDGFETETGVDEIVTKPVRKAVLHARVEGLLDRRQLSVALARQKAQSDQRFRTLFETNPDPVYVLGDDGSLLLANAAFRDLLEQEADDLLGRPLADFAVFSPKTAATLSEPRDGELATIEYTPQTGPPGYAEVNTARISLAGDRSELVGVLRDVTERRHRKRELQRQNERLDEFASILAHELRNPLGIAQMYLGMARAGDGAAFEQVEDAHSRIEEMINTLLDLARKGETVGDVEPLSLADVVERAWLAVDTSGATLSRDGVDRSVRADADRLLEVFENLFRNVVEHGTDGQAAANANSSLTIRVGTTAAGFFVEDDGTGIPAGQRKTIFDRGYSAADDGVGIGLTIVKRIVEAHGWSVAVTESEAGGARFEVTGVTFQSSSVE
ncbi:ATP-binding protein [Haladaptatus sp. DYSN1]|uniref:ATP-binding protein n=1 Tax=unclassified Haladaptatus TaxID=2622732 RepID=UPI0024066722|nr:ATP-binding protein [Haladaptatus sp. DYSN1]